MNVAYFVIRVLIVWRVSIGFIASAENPIRSVICEKKGCGSPMKLCTSRTQSSKGKKFLKCQNILCGKFIWLEDAIEAAANNNAGTKDKVHMKFVEVPRCIWLASYYPCPDATEEGEFEEDGVPILSALPDMVIDITAQHRLYTRSDLPNIIIEEMIDASTKTATRSSLPFARLVMVILTATGYKVFPNKPEDTKTKKLDASNCHKSVSHLPPGLPSELAPPGGHIGSSSLAAHPQEVFSLQSIGSMLHTVSTRLGAIEGRLGTMEGRLENIETDIRGLRQVQEPQEFEYDSNSGDA
ncbi:hypothetical protein GIB67_036259 [Kingdonia uniflora]|uniref:Zinc finger GRF-type domain-containing protein n=1 Tax=Kingdonia uniflora TaxID=39325 RepID=A0A7J7P9H4_9MAGN|nr:hypothetical protein GIB67_036259 [Kingdonia uniflora]